MKVTITGSGLVSSVGTGVEKLLEAYRGKRSALQFETESAAWLGRVPPGVEGELKHLQNDYPRLDRSVLFAILTAREAVARAGWNTRPADYGILLGSSRGASARWEAEHLEFQNEGRTSAFASPTTTLGNLSSWVGQDLGQTGFRASHSVTCSTAAHALVQGVAWLRAGMAKRMLVGGAEAPLTRFTLAQMRAMRIYATAGAGADWPCRPHDSEQPSGMVLGEGAGLLCLEAGSDDRALARVIGIGYAQEQINSPTGVDAQGAGIAAAMRMALAEAELEQVDLVVTHAPGTKRGDAAENAALRHVFGQDLPQVANTKWLQGHGLGASAAWSLILAIGTLGKPAQDWSLPYFTSLSGRSTSNAPVKTALVNAMGFGGNCVSICLGEV